VDRAIEVMRIGAMIDGPGRPSRTRRRCWARDTDEILGSLGLRAGRDRGDAKGRRDMSDADDVRDWWRTSIIDMEPGRIHLRGRPVQDLIGTTGFARDDLADGHGREISGPREALFEAALVAAVDHGPQAPSIAAARMAATCGVGLQSAMATGLNMLGDVHGGAGEQAVALYRAVEAPAPTGWPLRLTPGGPSMAAMSPASDIAFTSRSTRARRGYWNWWTTRRGRAPFPAPMPRSAAPSSGIWHMSAASPCR
jgi:hypothetical protein